MIELDFIQEYHQGNKDTADKDIDQVIFGSTIAAAERPLIQDRLIEGGVGQYGKEQLWRSGNPLVWTPYREIRELVRNLGLTQEEELWELGCGYARLALYAGIVTTAQCRGIEFLTERARLAQTAVKTLNLPNVEVIRGDVRDVDFSTGTIFDMYVPFTNATFEIVRKRLRAVAAVHNIKIIARDCEGETDCYDVFADENWLRITDTFDLGDTRAAIFESI